MYISEGICKKKICTHATLFIGAILEAIWLHAKVYSILVYLGKGWIPDINPLCLTALIDLLMLLKYVHMVYIWVKCLGKK